MRCEAVEERLDAFRTRELGGRERRAVARHLATCRPCATELSAVETLANRCAALRIRAPESLKTNVLAQAGDRYGVVETDLGRVWVGFNDRGITLIQLWTAEAASFGRAYEHRTGRRPVPAPVPARYARAVESAAAGAGPGNVPIDLTNVSPFARQVLELLPRIPRSEVRSYAWLAREAGRPRAVRAVGNAVAKNPLPLVLPCHRVVPSKGGVGNYALGTGLKRALLEHEGAPVAELEQLARAGVRYLGCRSTRIFCLPTCRDIRRARPENRVPLSSEAKAAEAGYRPCQRCRPVALAA